MVNADKYPMVQILLCTPSNQIIMALNQHISLQIGSSYYLIEMFENNNKTHKTPVVAKKKFEGLAEAFVSIFSP